MTSPPPEMSVIHWGRFSGTVPMLRDPLTRLAHVEFHDLGSLTKLLPLWPARGRAQVSAIGGGPWFKTAAWSRAIQGRAVAEGWVNRDRPTVFLQTLAAPILDPGYRYVVYTDRVAKEGAAEAAPYRSTWGRGWIEREEEFLRRAESVLVMGPSTKAALTGLYGIDSDQVEVVGAGPGTHIGPISRQLRPPRRLLFVGTNWGLKGGNEVLQAFARLGERHPELELSLVGSDPTEPLPPRTIALGRVPAEEMPGLFSESDLFVVPTYMEAFGYSLLEALMHGLPAIGSTVGNQGWLIGEAGATVPAGDVDRLVSAIEDVLADYSRFKERAISRAEQLRETMSWERVARAIHDALFAARDG